MFSAFPQLLSYWLYIPLLLRFTAGVYFIYFGMGGLGKDQLKKIKFFESIRLRPAKAFVVAFSVLEILCGLFLLIGLFVQVACIILLVICVIAILRGIKDPSLSLRSQDTYILLSVILVSLVFLGAGYYAIDLPL